MVETGVIHGRFQIFHLKHMEYLLAAKMRCKKLFIGITHSDIVAYAATSDLDMHGTTKRDNPLTYFERFEMIQEALADFGVTREEYEIIPYPISQPDLIPQYVPKGATHYISICSEWDEEQLRILEDLGLKTEVLWRKSPEEKGITGTDVRKLIAEEKDWKQYVPKTVSEYISRNEIEKRIRSLNYLHE